jgi:hypothetical protein
MIPKKGGSGTVTCIFGVWDITQYPECDGQDETYLHLFSCQHLLMKKALAETLAQIHKQGTNLMHMKSHFMDKFVKYIECGIAGEKIPAPAEPLELRKAILDQNAIGTINYSKAILLNHGQKLYKQ